MHSMIVPMEISRLGIVSTHMEANIQLLIIIKQENLNYYCFKLAALNIDKITSVNKEYKKKFSKYNKVKNDSNS